MCGELSVCVCVCGVHKEFIHAWKSLVLTQGNSFAFLTTKAQCTVFPQQYVQVLSRCYSLDNSTKKGNNKWTTNCNKKESFLLSDTQCVK